jgi:hypothetical protein
VRRRGFQAQALLAEFSRPGPGRDHGVLNMGLLDDLKKKAEMVSSQQLSQKTLTADAARLVEGKMKQTFLYVHDLLKQLAVLKPRNPAVFSVPRVGDLKDLKFASSFIDYRKKKYGDDDYYDTVSFHIRWQGDSDIVIDSDMPGTVSRIRDAVWRYKLKFTEEEKRNDRGSVVSTRFVVQKVIVCDMVVKADSERGRLVFSAGNLNHLGEDTFDVPAEDIGEPVLEALARMLLGEPSEFRKYRAATVQR